MFFLNRSLLLGAILFPKTAHMPYGGVIAQWLTFGFASSIYHTQLLQRSDVSEQFFCQFHRVCLNVFDIMVIVQHPEDDISKVDIEEPPMPPRPSAVEASAAQDIVAYIATFENADRTMWKSVFLDRLFQLQEPKNYRLYFETTMQSLWPVISRFLVDFC